MTLSPEMASILVRAACVLHNFLMRESDPLVQAVEARLTAQLDKEREERAEWNYRKKIMMMPDLSPLPTCLDIIPT